jgi:hypothetical protein
MEARLNIHLDQHANCCGEPKRPALLGQRRFIATMLVLFIIVAFGCGLIFRATALRREDCNDPKAPHCSREGGGNHKSCGKCSMECSGEGKKPDNDRNCSTFCCPERCDCFDPCS